MRRLSPTPWYTDGYRIYAATEDDEKRNGAVIAEGKPFETTQEDDLRLMAAAPDVRRKILALADEIESWKEFGFDEVIKCLREIARLEKGE